LFFFCLCGGVGGGGGVNFLKKCLGGVGVKLVLLIESSLGSYSLKVC